MIGDSWDTAIDITSVPYLSDAMLSTDYSAVPYCPVWWKITLTEKSSIRFDTNQSFGGQEDTKIYVYSGADYATRVQVGYDDDNGNAYWSLLEIVLLPGTYRIMVTQYNNIIDGMSYRLAGTLLPPPPPTILQTAVLNPIGIVSDRTNGGQPFGLPLEVVGTQNVWADADNASYVVSEVIIGGTPSYRYSIADSNFDTIPTSFITGTLTRLVMKAVISDLTIDAARDVVFGMDIFRTPYSNTSSTIGYRVSQEFPAGPGLRVVEFVMFDLAGVLAAGQDPYYWQHNFMDAFRYTTTLIANFGAGAPYPQNGDSGANLSGKIHKVWIEATAEVLEFPPPLIPSNWPLSSDFESGMAGPLSVLTTPIVVTPASNFFTPVGTAPWLDTKDDALSYISDGNRFVKLDFPDMGDNVGLQLHVRFRCNVQNSTAYVAVSDSDYMNETTRATFYGAPVGVWIDRSTDYAFINSPVGGGPFSIYVELGAGLSSNAIDYTYFALKPLPPASSGVTTSNSIFSCVDYAFNNAPYYNSVYTIEKSHSGTKSIIGVPGGVGSMQLAYDGDVTAVAENFTVWINAESTNYNPWPIYTLGMGALGANKFNDGYDSAVQISILEGSPGFVIYRVYAFIADYTSITTDVIVPSDTWVKLHITVSLVGSYTAEITNVAGASLFSIVRPLAGYFSFHELYPMDHDQERVFFDDVNMDSIAPPPPPPAPSGPVVPRLVWNKMESRYFEAGLDRGVLYPRGGQGVVWNGLMSVEEDGGDEATAHYLDGRPYLHKPKAKAYQANLTAYTYPDEFSEMMGIVEVATGLYADSQIARKFDLCYRTKIGNATEGIDHGYKIHLVYNATVTPDSLNYQSLSGDISPTTFSWQIQAVPVTVFGYSPTAHIVIDTRYTTPEKIVAVENLLYGGGNTLPALPDPQVLYDLLGFGDSIVVIDNGDGTFEVRGSLSNVYMVEAGIFQVDNVIGQDNNDGTFTISSTPAP